MGWTIDVPVTLRDEFAAALDRKLALLREAPAAASALIGWPQGTLDMHPAVKSNVKAEDLPEDRQYAPDEQYSWDRSTVRPDVLAQVERAVIDAKAQAAALPDACLSAGLVGHVQHPVLTGSEPTQEPTVIVEGHELSVLEANRAASAEKAAAPVSHLESIPTAEDHDEPEEAAQ